MPETQNQQTDNKAKKRKIALWVKIAGVIGVIILLLLLLHMCGQKKEPEMTGGVTFGVIDLEDGQSNVDPQELANSIVEQNQFRVFINTEIVVDAKRQADLMIQNDEANHYDCYVELIDNDTGKTLYKSDVVSPGFKIESDKLDKKLSEGVHNATAYFHVLDEDGSEINKIGVATTITAV